jgi:hypothetical protein
VVTRGAVALTLVFLGLAAAFAGFSLAAAGRGGAAAGAAALGLGLVATGVYALPGPVRGTDASSPQGGKASARDA